MGSGLVQGSLAQEIPRQASLTSPNGDIVRVPFSQLSTAGNYLGQSRNFFLIKDAISRQTYTSGASTVGYVFGSSTTGTSDSVLLGA